MQCSRLILFNIVLYKLFLTTELYLIFFNSCNFHQMLLQTNFQRNITVNWDRNTSNLSLFGIDIMATLNSF